MPEVEDRPRLVTAGTGVNGLKTGMNPTTDREQFTRSKYSNCKASYIGWQAETSTRDDWTQFDKHTRIGQANDHIALHHQLTTNKTDWTLLSA